MTPAGLQADELLDYQAVLSDPQRWHDLRRQGITASEIAVVLGIHHWQSRFGLWHRKKGLLPEIPDDPRMALGTYLEGYVAEQFGARFPAFQLTHTGLFACRERPWQLATPDRLVWWTLPPTRAFFPLAPLECKTSSSYEGWGADGSDDIPVYYRAQLMWQLDTLGLEEGYLACLFLLNQDLRVYHIQREEDECLLMRKAAQEFLAMEDAPDIDWAADTKAALVFLNPLENDEEVAVPRALVRSYRAAVRNAAAAEKRRKHLENLMRAAMGPGRYAVDARTGEKVATRIVYERAGYAVGPATVDRLAPAKERKETHG